MDEWIAKQYGEDVESHQASKKGASYNDIGTKGPGKRLYKKKVHSKEENSDCSSSSEQSRPSGAKPKVLKGLKNRKKAQAKNEVSNDSSSDSALGEKQKKKFSKKSLKVEPVKDQTLASSSKTETPTAATSWWKKMINTISNKDAKEYAGYQEV